MEESSFDGTSVLVTGGTGSFGQKFVEIFLKEYQPRRLIVFSRDELKQHQMRQRFPDTVPSPVRYFIGDVRDRDRLLRAFYGVDIVVHAAALKQVPAAEYNPFEAVLTNIIGTKNVVDAAIDTGVAKVIVLSTDKAVNPINLYGATKLVAEKLFIQGNSYAAGRGTRLSGIRYGNVVGSRGSVIPLFREQRKAGQITITDKRMTRFWITVEEGARFVTWCLERMQGGEVFVPKIASMRLTDLAQAIAPGCRWEITGVRPGEKIHEVLISVDEARQTLEFENMFVIQPLFPWWSNEKWQHGTPLPEGFWYGSDNNSRWLSPDELKTMTEDENDSETGH